MALALALLAFAISCTMSGVAGWHLRGGSDAAKRIEVAMRLTEHRRLRHTQLGPFPARDDGPTHTVEMRRVQ